MTVISQPTGNQTSQSLRMPVLLVLSALVTVSLSNVACPQDSGPQTTVDASPQEESPTNAAEPLEKAEQRRQALAGLLALAGIAIAGIGLATVTILWGARLRRETRKPMPPTAPRDDLWFLRPPKSLPEDSPPPTESPRD